MQINSGEDWDNQIKQNVTSARFNSFRQTESIGERETFGAKKLRASPIIKTKGATNRQQIIETDVRNLGSSPFDYSQDQATQNQNQAIMRSPRGAKIRAKMVRLLTLLQMKLKARFNQLAIRMSKDQKTVQAYRHQEQNYYREGRRLEYKQEGLEQYQTDSQSDQLNSLNPQHQTRYKQQRKQKYKQPRGAQTKQQYANSSGLKSVIGKQHATERIQRAVHKVYLRRYFQRFAIVFIKQKSYLLACQYLRNSLVFREKMKYFQIMKRNIRFQKVKTILGRGSKVMDNVVTKYAKQIVFTRWSNLLRQRLTTQLFRFCATRQILSSIRNSLSRSFYSLSQGSFLKQIGQQIRKNEAESKKSKQKRRTPQEMKEIRLEAFQRLIHSDNNQQTKIIEPDVFDGEYQINLIKFIDVQERKLRFMKKKMFKKWFSSKTCYKLRTLRFQQILEKRLVQGDPNTRIKNKFADWRIQTRLLKKRLKVPDQKHARLAKAIQRVLIRTRNQSVRKYYDKWNYANLILSKYAGQRHHQLNYCHERDNMTPPVARRNMSPAGFDSIQGRYQQSDKISTPLQLMKKKEVKSPYTKQFKH